MNDLSEAAIELHEYLRTHDVSHFFIGGVAAQYWGEPRATADVDVCVIAPAERMNEVIQLLVGRFRSRFSDAAAFAAENRILPVLASNGCGVDVSFGGPWFEEEAAARAVPVEISPGKSIPMCSAGDLVVYKAVAGRPTDVRDIGSIIERQKRDLDARRIRRLLREFKAITNDDEPLRVFDHAWKKHGPQAED